MRWLQEEERGRPLVSHFFASPRLAMTTSLTAALTQVPVSSKETRVQVLFWEIQMGVNGKRGETRFHGFKLALPWYSSLPNLSSFGSQAEICFQQHSTAFHTLASPLLRDTAGKWLVCSCSRRSGSTMHCMPAFTEFSDCCAPLWLPTSLQGARHTDETQRAACLPQLPLNMRDVKCLG